MTITTFKNICGSAAVILATAGMLGCNSESTSNEKSVGYTLTDHEKHILKITLIDELKVKAEGGKVIFPDLVNKILGDFVTTTSDELQREYERNEVAGDRAFRKKTIFINGVVKSIDRSVGENYFISLKGGTNPFMSPKASMADGYTDFLADLEKENEVTLVCVGNGMLIGSAMLSNCEPLFNYVSRTANNFVENLNLRDAVAEKDKYTPMASAFAMAVTSLLTVNSTCFTAEVYDDKCVADMMKAVGGENKEKAAALDLAMQNSLTKIGLDKDVWKSYKKAKSS